MNQHRRNGPSPSTTACRSPHAQARPRALVGAAADHLHPGIRRSKVWHWTVHGPVQRRCLRPGGGGGARAPGGVRPEQAHRHRHPHRAAAACRRSRRTAPSRPPPSAQRDPAQGTRGRPLQHRRENSHPHRGPFAEHRRRPLRRRRRHGPHPGDLTLPGQRTQLDDYIDELTALRGEVAKIGHNVNQIAKKLNSGDRPHPWDTALLDHAERVLDTAGTAVRHIAATTNQVAATKGPR